MNEYERLSSLFHHALTARFDAQERLEIPGAVPLNEAGFRHLCVYPQTGYFSTFPHYLEQANTLPVLRPTAGNK